MNYITKLVEELFVYKTNENILKYIKEQKILSLIQNPKFKTDENN
jgi:hypothetical protein